MQVHLHTGLVADPVCKEHRTGYDLGGLAAAVHAHVKTLSEWMPA